MAGRTIQLPPHIKAELVRKGLRRLQTEYETEGRAATAASVADLLKHCVKDDDTLASLYDALQSP